MRFPTVQGSSPSEFAHRTLEFFLPHTFFPYDSLQPCFVGLPPFLFPYLREGVYISLSWPSRLILIQLIFTINTNKLFGFFFISSSRSSITSLSQDILFNLDSYTFELFIYVTTSSHTSPKNKLPTHLNFIIFPHRPRLSFAPSSHNVFTYLSQLHVRSPLLIFVAG